MTALDTNIFIYVLESNEQFGPKAASVLRRAQGNGCASQFIYLELLSSRAFSDDHKRNIAISFLDSQRLQFIEANKQVLLEAARLRATMTPKIGAGDALHLASALAAGADEFVTNDQDLFDVKIKGLKISPLS